MESAPRIDRSEVSARLVPVMLGGDVLAYSVARCLFEAFAIKTTVISNIDVKITSTSRFVDYRIFDAIAEEERLIEYLSDLGREIAAAGKVGLLIGSADWHARFLSHAKATLAPWFHIPVSDPELFDAITQKSVFYRRCEERGVPHPQTWNLDPAGAMPDAEDFPYPLILKPSHSPSWDLMEFEGKRKIWELQSPDEFRRAWAAIAASDYEQAIIAQDFIPGGDDEIRSFTCLADTTGEIKLVSGGRVVLQDHSPLALGNPVCILGERVEEIIDGAKKLLAGDDYRGYANFDIKRDPRDGTFKFFEVNARAGRNTYYVTLGGVNFAEALVRAFVIGDTLDYAEAYRPFCYGLAPFSVIKNAGCDAALVAEAEAFKKRGAYLSPLASPDDSLAHKLMIKAYEARQVSKFKAQSPNA